VPDRLTILAIDVALGHCAAALVSGDVVRAVTIDPTATGHAERLAPMVSDLFGQSGLGPADVQRVVVTTGPGSFTGIRTGLAFARSFAAARDVPVVGLSSLMALALGHVGAVCVYIDGRTSVFVQRVQDGKARGEPKVIPRDALASQTADAQTVIAYNLPDVASQNPDAMVVHVAGVDPVALARWGAMADVTRNPALAHYLRDAGARLPACPA
jgi:tRNA threonylcarbamoyladenosine biosynthesis protein TsaB